MKNARKIPIIVGLIALATFLVFFFVCIYPWIALWFGLAISPNPPKPEISYGEFPFQLTYELNDETKIIKDVAICKFDGYGKRTEAGQSRKWKVNLKSKVDDPILDSEQSKGMDFVWITLLDLRNDSISDDNGYEILELYFFGGNGHYYMNDELGGHDRKAQDFTWVNYMYKTENGTIGHSAFTAEKAYEKFGIRLISWEASEPIQNTFS